MNEPIILKRYEEQDIIEKAIKILGESTVEQVDANIIKHDGKTETIYMALLNMYKIFCHSNGLYNKLEDEQ